MANRSAGRRELESVLITLVRTWMVANHLSQGRAAARLRVPPSWLRKFLGHKIVRLRTGTIQRLARGLDVPEAVVRLAALTDVADEIAGSLEPAVDAAATRRATDG